MTAIYFENVSLSKLREFKVVLNTLRHLRNVIAPLAKEKSNFRSVRLAHLVGDELFPDMRDALDEFE